jgi:hypothetical protein
MTTSSPNPASTPVHGDDAPAAARRRVLKLLAASAGTLAVQACGGGGGGGSTTLSTGTVFYPGTYAPPGTQPPPPQPPSMPPPTTAPVWTTVPDLNFTQGVAASIGVGQYVTDDAVKTLLLALTAGALPPGVTFNPATKSFDYDGVGAAATATGLVLTATEG